MADNSDMEVMTVLPKELRLGAPPTMPQARSYMFRQQSTLSAYNYDEQIQINIPRLQRSYLSKDSYLEFSLNGQFKPGTPVVSGTSFQMVPDLFLDDAGAWSVFERLEVFDYLGSTVLENIDSVPQLMSLLVDMGADFTDPDHKGPAIHGLNDSYVATNSNDASVYYMTEPVQIPNTATFPYTMASPKIFIDNVLYTWAAPGGTATYDNMDSFLVGLNEFLEGLDLNISAILNDSTYDRGISFQKPGASFTIKGDNTASGNANLMNFLGYNSGGTIYTSSNAGVNIVSSTGVSKSFYCGGTQLVGNGTTRSTTNSYNAFSVNYCIPLPSFLGFLSKKMVPLHNGFTIVLTIASKFKPMFMAPKQVPVTIFKPGNNYTGNVLDSVVTDVLNAKEPSLGPTANDINRPALLPDPEIFWWNITDVNMVCHILELGPVAESMILSSSQGQPLIVHTKQLRNYRGNISKGSAEFSLPLNLNVSSLTNILWFMRPDGTENSLKYASIGARHRNSLQRWEFQYGSTVLPQSQGIKCMNLSAPIVPSGITTPFTGNVLGLAQYNGYGECFAELLKSRPCNPTKGRFTRENFCAWWYNAVSPSWVNFGFTPFRCSIGESGSSISGAGSGKQGNEIGKFACGLNTELVTGKSGDLICGLNTNGMNTSIRGYFLPSTLSDLACVLDAYAEYDAFINISPGIATTVSY